MKICHILFFILLICNIFSYETAKYSYEKEWSIIGEEGTEYTLNATFLINNSVQKIISLSLSEGELLEYEGNLVFYSEGILDGNDKVITANAIIEIEYSPFLNKDVPLGEINTPKGMVEAQAYELLDSSSTINTVVAFTQWINENIEYDLGSSDIVEAEDVLEQKTGVCTGYANLLIAFLEYAGIEAKQITGYAESEVWRPHAWVEVKIGNEWIAVDPTYNEIGIVNDHIKSKKNPAGSKSSDILSSVGSVDDFSYDVKIEKFYSKELELPVHYSFVNSSDKVEVIISNPASKYVLVSYSFYFSEGWGEKVDKVLVIPPKDEVTIVHDIILSEGTSVTEGYVYHVPFVFYIMDEEIEGGIEYVSKGESNGGNNIPCLSGFLILFLTGWIDLQVGQEKSERN